MFNTIQVNWEATSRPYQANKYLNILRNYESIAWDLEVAIKYTSAELEEFKAIAESPDSSKIDVIKAKAKIHATALDHPSHCTVTHCSIAASEDIGFVFILDNPQIKNLVFNYLIASEQTQILHNASYDFRHLWYHTGELPKNYEDTQILAKTLLNHVLPSKAQTGLKNLAGGWYGDWGIAADNFTVEQMYEPHVLKYAAIDACATFKLWEFMQSQCDEIDKEITEEYYADTN